MSIVFKASDDKYIKLIQKQLLERNRSDIKVVGSDYKGHIDESNVEPNKEFAEFLDCAGTVMEHGFHDEVYSPPEYGQKEELEKEKSKCAAIEIKHLVSEEPTLMSRDNVNVFVKKLEAKAKKIPEMNMKELMALYDMTNDVHTIIYIAHRINQLKNGTKYKANTIDWITDKWIGRFNTYPENKIRWTKTLKTRAKNIVRDNKKLASLYYFIDFLVENKDNSY